MEPYHVSSMIRNFVFLCRKKAVSVVYFWQVYNKTYYFHLLSIYLGALYYDQDKNCSS